MISDKYCKVDLEPGVLPVNREYISGLDARGFLIAPMVAIGYGKAFVPIRKAGKLPGATLRKESLKEYGEDILEIQADAINAGDKVVIIDDLLATGGTMMASCELVKKAQGNVIGSLCLVELESLKGREKLDVPFHSFIKYE